MRGIAKKRGSVPRTVKRILIATGLNIIAIFVASVFISGVDYGSDFWILVLAGFIFALVNWLVKPLVTFLSIPLIIITFGIALFGVNILMLYLTSWIVPDFVLESFGSAVLATLVIWIVNMALRVGFQMDESQQQRR